MPGIGVLGVTIVPPAARIFVIAASTDYTCT
jgi:hypothetical protein